MIRARKHTNCDEAILGSARASRAAFGALAERNELRGEGAANDTRGRVRSPDYRRAWQRQEAVIFVSALAQIFWNLAFVATASSSFFFCSRKLSARPKSDQPLSGSRARSSR